jgi:hypothetical protein
MYPSVVFVALLLWSFLWPKQNLVYLVFGCAAFGSLAVIPPGWVGGFDLLPSSLAAAVLAARYFTDRHFLSALPSNAFRLDRLGLLTGFMAIAALSAIFYPRLFEGQMDVAAVRGAIGPLAPSGANFTQLAYLFLTYAVVLAVYHSAGDRAFLDKLFRALLLGGVILISTGLADMVLGGSGSSSLLAPFKTANYAYLEGAEVLGSRRVVGVMSEASAFGPTCVSYGLAALFGGALFDSRRTKLLALAIAAAAFSMAALSTSSTAIVGLAVALGLYSLNLGKRSLDVLRLHGLRPGSPVRIAEVSLLYLIGAATFLTAAFRPATFNTPVALVQELVFRKALSDSFYERMQWNQLAYDALKQTHWIGVGVGGARTSNWFVSILSNTGIVGALLLFTFVLWLLTCSVQAKTRYRSDLVGACRAVIVAGLVMAGLSASSPDFGIGIGAMLAVLARQVGRKPPEARDPTISSRDAAGERALGQRGPTGIATIIRRPHGREF